MTRPGRIVFFVWLAVAGLIHGAPQASAGVLDPTGFSAQGTLVLNAGSIYTFNSAPGMAPLISSYNFSNGQLTTIAAGFYSNGVAVFDFESITIQQGASLLAPQLLGLNVTSSGFPIALLSRTFVTIDGVINVSAVPNASMPLGGPGAGNLANGQNGGGASSGGSGQGAYVTSGGGGGGFGGAGGAGQSNFIFNPGTGITPVAGGAGGQGQFNLSTLLQGGSYGGGGGSGLGGAGGGAVELVATTSLSVSGTIKADGAAPMANTGPGSGAGGGSGGGIYLHGNSVAITGTLQADGAAGGLGTSPGLTSGGGGGGGGGLIRAEYTTGTYSNTGTVNVLGGGNGTNGLFTPLAVPEPSSLLMLSLAAGGLLGAAVIRGRRPKMAG